MSNSFEPGLVHHERQQFEENNRGLHLLVETAEFLSLIIQIGLRFSTMRNRGSCVSAKRPDDDMLLQLRVGRNPNVKTVEASIVTALLDIFRIS